MSMLDNLNGPSESELVKRIAAIRNPQPDSEPSEEPKAVNVSDLDDTPDEIEADASPDIQAEAEADDSEELDTEADETVEVDDSETETLYLDLDGEEVTLDQVKEWKQGNLRQADYTRKTQELAEQRKALEAESSKLADTQKQLADSIAELQAQLEIQSSEINWEELREYDPSEYLKQKELMEKKAKALEKAKGFKANLDDSAMQQNIQAEQRKLLEANPTWLDKSGNVTQQYQKDMEMVNQYLADTGYAQDEIASILSAKHWMTILDAAKYRTQSKKADTLTKKVKKAPLVTKPKSQAKSNIDRQLQAAYKKMKATGRIEDAQAYMKLKRQKGN